MPIQWQPRDQLAAEAVRMVQFGEHVHQYKPYLHTAYVLVRKP